MDFYRPPTAEMLAQQGRDRRRSPRKSMRQRVIVGTKTHGILRGQTVDISVGGLSILMPIALPAGAVCAVHFDLFLDGATVRFAGTGQVANCSCSGMEGFRIGMRFKLQNPEQEPRLAEFLKR